MNLNKLIDSQMSFAENSSSDQKNEWNSFWKKNRMQKILDKAREYETNFYLKNILYPYFDTTKSFCELGCGTAILLRDIAAKYKNVVAIDYSTDSLNIAKSVFENAQIINYELQQQDIRDTEKSKPIYDVVFSNGLIEHFKEPYTAIESHLRYAKSGGVVVILAPYKYSLKYLWFKITDNKYLKKLWPWTEQYFFTKRSMEAELSKIDKEKYEWHNIVVLHNVENVLLVIKRA